MLQKYLAHCGSNGFYTRIELLPNPGQHAANVIMAHGGRRTFPTTALLLDNLPLSAIETKHEFVDLLLSRIDCIHHAGESAMLREFGKCLSSHEQAIAHGAFQAPMQAFGLFLNFLTGADHEFRGG